MTTSRYRFLSNICRAFSTTMYVQNTFREGRFLGKMIARNAEKKLYESSRYKAPKLVSISKHRESVLNKLFMTNITDSLAYGDASRHVANRGLEITKVAVASDFGCVKVYWVASESENRTEIEDLLASISKVVQFDLRTNMLMSRVPDIVFVEDLQLVNVAKTTKALHDLSLELGRDSVSMDIEENAIDPEAELSEMKMNTFGLKYDVIMKKIQTSKLKGYPTQIPEACLPQRTADEYKSSEREDGIGPSKQNLQSKTMKKFMSSYLKKAKVLNERQLIFEQILEYHEETIEDDDEDVDSLYNESEILDDETDPSE